MRLILHASLPGQLRNQMMGNEVANLTQDTELTLRWLLLLAFLFHTRALWHGATQKPTLLLSKPRSPYGMAVKLICRRLLRQVVRFALALALLSTGSSRANRMAIMATTTSSSINVNARFQFTIFLDTVEENRLQFGLGAAS